MRTLPILPVVLLGLALSWTAAAQTAPSKELLPPLPAGKEWKLIWNDEFDGTKLDETKWNRLGDNVRKGGWWMKDRVFYVDGREVWRTKAGGVSQVPEFIKLTEEIGTWGGDIKKAELPDFCEVDYVRVYEMSK